MLERGAAVFCQKPLGRTAAEVRAVVDAARAADRLIGVDLSYRFTTAMRLVRDLVRSGELGRIFAVDLVFHNAYGPDKPWFYDPILSGGGCVMDLGVHLVDLALWTMDFRAVAGVRGTLFAGGEPLNSQADRVEDYAVATIELETGAVVQLACSWRLHAGCDAMISAAFHGTHGGAAPRNVNGSFYDFVAERYAAPDGRRWRPRRTSGAGAQPRTGLCVSRPASGSTRRWRSWSTSPGCWTEFMGVDEPEQELERTRARSP